MADSDSYMPSALAASRLGFLTLVRSTPAESDGSAPSPRPPCILPFDSAISGRFDSARSGSFHQFRLLLTARSRPIDSSPAAYAARWGRCTLCVT